MRRLLFDLDRHGLETRQLKSTTTLSNSVEENTNELLVFLQGVFVIWQRFASEGFMDASMDCINNHGILHA